MGVIVCVYYAQLVLLWTSIPSLFRVVLYGMYGGSAIADDISTHISTYETTIELSSNHYLYLDYYVHDFLPPSHDRPYCRLLFDDWKLTYDNIKNYPRMFRCKQPKKRMTVTANFTSKLSIRPPVTFAMGAQLWGNIDFVVLKRWMIYYKKLGIQHIFFYSLDTQDPNLHSVISYDWLVLDWSKQFLGRESHQLWIYNNCLLRSRFFGVTYLLLIDIDEFLYLGNATLSHFQSLPGLAWTFGSRLYPRAECNLENSDNAPPIECWQDSRRKILFDPNFCLSNFGRRKYMLNINATWFLTSQHHANTVKPDWQITDTNASIFYVKHCRGVATGIINEKHDRILREKLAKKEFFFMSQNTNLSSPSNGRGKHKGKKRMLTNPL